MLSASLNKTFPSFLPYRPSGTCMGVGAVPVGTRLEDLGVTSPPTGSMLQVSLFIYLILILFFFLFFFFFFYWSEMSARIVGSIPHGGPIELFQIIMPENMSQMRKT